MSGRGGGNKKYRGGGRGGGHRQAVKTLFGNKFNIRREKREQREQGGDEDVPMQPQNHKIMITGYSHGANTEVIRTLLLGKVEGLKFLEFSVQDSKIVATVASKAEANALSNISGLIFANKKV